MCTLVTVSFEVRDSVQWIECAMNICTCIYFNAIYSWIYKYNILTDFVNIEKISFRNIHEEFYILILFFDYKDQLQLKFQFKI